MDVVKVIIVKVSTPYLWYKDMKGKSFHVYGTIDHPLLIGGTTLTCIENSFMIDYKDVIFITN